MRKKFLLAVVLIVDGIFPTVAVSEVALKSEHDRISYSVGYQVATDLKANNVVINKAALMRAVEDVLTSAKPAMSDEEMRSTLVEFKRKIIYAEKKEGQQQAEKRRRESAEFLAANGKKEGIVTTRSGLQYRILLEGQGKSPSADDEVTVHYRGTTIDGHEFDSSSRKGKPASFKLGQVIRGWTEGLQLLKEGGKISLFIPPELAYGERGPLAHQTLIFEIELIAVNPPSPAKK